jgi:hypothetical protein
MKTYYKIKPRWSGKRIIITFLFLNILSFAISLGKPYFQFIMSNYIISTICFLINIFSLFVNFTFIKQPNEIDLDKVFETVDEKDNIVRAESIAENKILKAAYNDVKEKVHNIDASFDNRALEKYKIQKKEDEDYERAKRQSTW